MTFSVSDMIASDAVKRSKVEPQLILKIAIGAVRNTLIKHFREKNMGRNKLGGAKTQFWRRVSESVSMPNINNAGARVSVTHPHLGTHVYGATITPKRAKMLTIPVHPDAHGKRAAEIPELTVRPWGLAIGDVTYYVFAKRAVIPKDPTALPSEEVMKGDIDRNVGSLIKRQK